MRAVIWKYFGNSEHFHTCFFYFTAVKFSEKFSEENFFILKIRSEWFELFIAKTSSVWKPTAAVKLLGDSGKSIPRFKELLGFLFPLVSSIFSSQLLGRRVLNYCIHVAASQSSYTPHIGGLDWVDFCNSFLLPVLWLISTILGFHLMLQIT